jgi:hypothetical protein
MEALPGQEIEALPHVPLRLRVESDPRPRVLIGFDGQEVDVTQALIRLELVLDDVGCRVLIDARCDLGSFDFPVTTVMRPSAGLDGLTAGELDEVVAEAGYSQSPGEAILEYLGSRLPD